jgi:hypothetical protein
MSRWWPMSPSCMRSLALLPCARKAKGWPVWRSSQNAAMVFPPGNHCCPNGNSYCRAIATMLYTSFLRGSYGTLSYLQFCAGSALSIRHRYVSGRFAAYCAGPGRQRSAAAYRLFGLPGGHGRRDAVCWPIADKSGRKPVAIFGSTTLFWPPCSARRRRAAISSWPGALSRASAPAAATSSLSPCCAIRSTIAVAPGCCRC